MYVCVLALDSRSIEYSVKTRRKKKISFLGENVMPELTSFFFFSLGLLATAFGCFLRQPLGIDMHFLHIIIYYYRLQSKREKRIFNQARLFK